MAKALFTGVCTALITPFLDLEVNYPLLQQLIKRQIASGIEAIVLCGTTGEASTLTDEEKLRIFRCGKEYADNRCLLIAGTGSNDTVHAVKLSIEAQAQGADALLVVSPYYNKATEQGLLAHYRAIADSVQIPVILYNVPSRTGVDIPINVYKQLSSHPNIAGVKEASTDITKITKIRLNCPDGFAVWTGNDPFTVPAMALGADGVISVISNVWPKRMKAMAEAIRCGDYTTAAKLQYSMDQLQDLMFVETNPVPVKAAMKYVGFDCGSCRLPLTNASEETERKLHAFFHT